MKTLPIEEKPQVIKDVKVIDINKITEAEKKESQI